MFCSVMRFYALSYRDALALPIKTFWLLFRNTARIAAAEDRRSLDVAVSAGSGDAYRAGVERYNAEIGEVLRAEPVWERDKIRDLARRMGAALPRKVTQE